MSVLTQNSKAGSRNSYEPRLISIGEIIKDSLLANSPFASNYAKWKELKDVKNLKYRKLWKK